MIDRIRGAVLRIGGDDLSVDLGPIALRVVVPAQVTTEVRLGSDVELHTAMVVREDGWTLYGFIEAEHCQVFEQVQTVSGIGPRIALALVSVLGPDDLRRAVETEDLASLTKVPGIGKKGAQRIVLELKDRLGPSIVLATSVGGRGSESWRAGVAAALTSLGWNPREAEAAVDQLAGRLGEVTDPDAPDVGVLLKEALRSLDRS
jgi:Holliday junction DNA helicase RuvA